MIGLRTRDVLVFCAHTTCPGFVFVCRGVCAGFQVCVTLIADNLMHIYTRMASLDGIDGFNDSVKLLQTHVAEAETALATALLQKEFSDLMVRKRYVNRYCSLLTHHYSPLLTTTTRFLLPFRSCSSAAAQEFVRERSGAAKQLGSAQVRMQSSLSMGRAEKIASKYSASTVREMKFLKSARVHALQVEKKFGILRKKILSIIGVPALRMGAWDGLCVREHVSTLVSN